MDSCAGRRAFGLFVVLNTVALLIGVSVGTTTAAQPAIAASSAPAPVSAASARTPNPRVQRIVVPESSIRVYAKETGQTSLSSARIHGLRVGNPQSTAVTGDLLILGGAVPDREFCVDVVRINNLFGLSFVFTTPSKADVYSVSFRTRAWAAQLPMASGELSVRVRARNRGQCVGPLLAAGWEYADDSRQIWVPYNAGQANAARLQVGKGLTEACTPTKELLPRDVQAVQYNFICKFPQTTTRCDRPTTVRVQRDMGARSDPDPDRMDIHLPCISARG